MTDPNPKDDFCPKCGVEWRLCDCDEVLAYGFGDDDFDDDDDYFTDETEAWEGDDYEEDEDE